MIPRQHFTEIETAKNHLKELGLSHRRAAPILGCTYSHLAKVMAHLRYSHTLCQRIMSLSPSDPTPQSPAPESNKTGVLCHAETVKA